MIQKKRIHAFTVVLLHLHHVCLPCNRLSPARTSTSELSVGLGADTRFLNHVAWNLGVPLFDIPEDSEEAAALELAPRRNRYATLLADTISVLACLNCLQGRE